MKKTVWLNFIIFCIFVEQATGAWYWPPENGEVIPQYPTSADIVVITLSGNWPSSCVPSGSAISVTGNEIYFDVIAHPPSICLCVITPWERRRSVGPLAAGTYTVYVRLVGDPGVPTAYTMITEFTVTAESHAATVYYVDGANGDNNNDGLSEESAFATIQKAVDTAKSGDSIIIGQGVYGGDGNHNIDFSAKAISIRSTDPNDPDVVAATIIDCQQNGSGFRFRSNEPRGASVSGLTIINASTSAIYCHDYSGPTIDKCVIMYNQGFAGGGIFCRSFSSPTIRNCTISSNTVGDDGGGIYCLANSDPTITNCVVSDNSAGDYGGGIDISHSNPTILNCTITGNSAVQRGGGVNVYHIANVGITNNILWDNIASNGPQIAILDASCSVSYSNLQSGQGDVYINIRPRHGCDDCMLNWGPGNIDADPLFVDPCNGNYHLLPDSPCINIGDPNFIAEVNETDLDGRPRIIGPFVDMGAYEFNCIPIADAGPNQVVTAGPNGMAIVTLDSSGSYDGDDHDLTCLWSWSIDGNDFNSTEPNAVIHLPAGLHEITLIVNDGIEDSEPDTVTIKVVWPPVRANLRIYPKTIIRHNRAKWVFAMIKLPPRIRPQMINWQRPLLLLPGRIEAIWKHVFRHARGKDKSTYILAVFEKYQLMDAIGENGPVTIRVVGFLKNGREFIGRDIIRIISPRQGPKLGLPHPQGKK
jgi:parallel beta-helix repeat protein